MTDKLILYGYNPDKTYRGPKNKKSEYSLQLARSQDPHQHMRGVGNNVENQGYEIQQIGFKEGGLDELERLTEKYGGKFHKRTDRAQFGESIFYASDEETIMEMLNNEDFIAL